MTDDAAMRRRRFRRVGVVAAVASVLVAAGVVAVATREGSAEPPSTPPAMPATIPVPVPPPPEPDPEPEPEPEPGFAVAVSLVGDQPVYAAPGSAEPVEVLPAETVLGTPARLAVLGEEAVPPAPDAEPAGDGGATTWLSVQLPTRPHGRTGWVPAGDVVVRHVQDRITVDVEARRLVHERDGEIVREVDVAVGSDAHPTPRGAFFVTDIVATGNPAGAYGPYAIGISAYSDTIDQMNGFDAQIAIHGTNRPGSIGTAASLGCVRVDNDVVELLAAELPLGTPVVIR